VAFRLIRQPSVLGYLAAGLIVGPYIPIPLFADPDRVHALSEFGVILVMFAIGLEFRLDKLFRVLPVSGFTCLLQIGIMFWVGFSLGQLFGWGNTEALFLGASIAISSTMVVSKVYDEREIRPDVREMVFGILIIQDVVAIALIAAMTAVAEGGGVSAGEMMATVGRLGLALVGFLVIGMLLVPRAVRGLARLENRESLVVGSIGLCFVFALLAESLGYSVALGAFIAGILVAESGRGADIEHDIQPVKDIFAAVFFVSVGMTVDPKLAWDNLGPSMIVFVAVIVTQFLSVSIGNVISGNGQRRGIKAGLSLGQIGEFAFIIAGIGVAAGVVRPDLQPILVTVAILTTFTTPLALDSSNWVLCRIDHFTPSRLQNLLCVYEAWFEKVRAGNSGRAQASPLRRAGFAIVFDAVGLFVLLIAWMRWAQDLGTWLGTTLDLSPEMGLVGITLLMMLPGLPLLFGLLRNTHTLTHLVADTVVGGMAGSAGTMVTNFLRFSVRMLVGMGIAIPLGAIFWPVLDAVYTVPIVLAVLLVGIYFVWRKAGRIDREIRSGAERVIHTLAKQRGHSDPAAAKTFLPGIKNVVSIQLEPSAPAVGKTLAELNLRAVTGASVLAIHRQDQDVIIPTGSETLAAGDLLALTGSSKSIELARRLILAEAPPVAVGLTPVDA
jgi:CPA2 family monovalent cation:H+ antiporter-2